MRFTEILLAVLGAVGPLKTGLPTQDPLASLGDPFMEHVAPLEWLLLPEEPATTTLTSETVSGHHPVVIWHGLGDNYNASGMVQTQRLVEKRYPGIYVHRVRLDDNPLNDQQKSLVGDAVKQLGAVCEQVGAIPELARGFDMIGFSQGGVFSRALVQTCANATVRNLVTFGSPHMGVQELPRCDNPRDWVCKRRNAVLKQQVWHESVQRTVIPAQYFRDTFEYQKYVEHSHFLAPINNEATEDHPEYRERLSRLEMFVMVVFARDTTVNPKESAQFGEIDPATNEVIPMEQTPLYKEDRLGLDHLNREGRLVMEEVDDVHMAIPAEFLERVVERYLG